MYSPAAHSEQLRATQVKLDEANDQKKVSNEPKCYQLS